MESREQPEILQNDWESFSDNVRIFWERYGTAVVLALLVLSVSFAGYRLLSAQRENAREGAWADLAYETSPDGLRQVAEEHDDPAVRSLAYLRAGDLLLAQATNPQQETTPTETTPEGEAATPPAATVDPKAALDDAGRMYDQALATAQHDVYRFNARLGLAAVAETKGEWDAARQHYEAVRDGAREPFPLLAAQAENRLGLLDRLKAPLPFAPEPPPAAAAPASAAPAAATDPAAPTLDLPIPSVPQTLIEPSPAPEATDPEAAPAEPAPTAAPTAAQEQPAAPAPEPASP